LLYLVDAFSEKPYTGNPTALFLENEQNLLSEEMKVNIAKEMNLPVTAFISKSKKADYKLEFYTPKTKPVISGHATIAAFWLLAELGQITPKNDKSILKVETQAGIFPIEILWQNKKVEKIFLTQKKPFFKEINLSIDKLADILGIRSDKIESNEKLPIVIADTGNPSLLILISSKEMTDAMVPNFDEIERLCKKYQVNGLHLYTFDTYLEGSTCYTRHFEPMRGVPESVVSGMSNGALGAFLVSKGFAQPGTLIFEQGESQERPGKVEVKIKAEGNDIKSIKIGGKAITIFKFNFFK